MRPLRISIRGLRSYREPCDIDFTGKTLIAIVGDTGAGKSSILEALTYALYNATTWDDREVKLLIADGMQTMSVELDFQADGKRWRIHRASSRTNYPPSVHKLTCLEDRTVVIDGEEQVKRAVERLVGMNRRAFLSAVILPQGRFQTLLQDSPGDRTRILKGIFRLTELEDVRKAADELNARVEPVLEGLKGHRQALLADPQAEALAQRSAHQQLEKRDEALREVRKRVVDNQRVGAEVKAKVTRWNELAGRVPDADLGAARQLKALIPVSVDIQQAVAQGLVAKADLEGREKLLRKELQKAAAAGASYEQLNAGALALAEVQRGLTEVERSREGLKAEKRALTADKEVLEREANDLNQLKRVSDGKSQAAQAAEEAFSNHHELVSQAKERLSVARMTVSQAKATQERLIGLGNGILKLEEVVMTAQKAALGAEEELERASRQLSLLQRDHAAAHASADLKPGDKCPICARSLPTGFKPLEVPGLEDAQNQQSKAENEAKEARNRSAAVQASLSQARQQLDELKQAVEKAQIEAENSRRALSKFVPDANLDRPEAVVLRPLAEKDDQLKSAADKAKQEAKQTQTEYDKRRGAFDGQEKALKARLAHVPEEEHRIAALFDQSRKGLKTLPAFLKRPKELTAASLEPLTDDLNKRLHQVRQERDSLDRVIDQIRSADSQLNRLRERLRDEVEMPKLRMQTLLSTLLARVNDCQHELKDDAAPSLAEGSSVDELVIYADQLERAAKHVVDTLNKAGRALESEVCADAVAVGELLEKHGFANQEELEQALKVVAETLGEVNHKLKQAEEQIPIAATLDTAIERGTEIGRSLDELVRLLADGQFVGFVIERRQRALLAVASETLGSMTGNRYGFSADFQVVDRLTGQPRSPRTLSGGETFLASLALALALVEIATRAGGRLDALFLDEGFGSLDASALDEALSALERRASAGRLVAVISHVKAVAERIETVLEVTSGPRGSQAAWRDPTERAAMVEEELEVGLLG